MVALLESAGVENGGFVVSERLATPRLPRRARSAELRQALGRQGRQYAESEYGNVDRFIGRVRDAIAGP
jgi:hypothetical protein